MKADLEFNVRERTRTSTSKNLFPKNYLSTIMF